MSPPRSGSTRSAVALALVALLALVLWGGYSRRWGWTGINGQTATLWDWLKLLLLPVTVAILPVWTVRELRLDRTVKRGATAAAVAFAVLVAFGYLMPWAWTGFVGNTLWDWLNLVALPLAVALIPFWRELREDWHRHHTVIAGTLAVALLVVVVGGYLGDWGWTGFTGNTLWQWLHLLLLPLLVPVVVIPALKPRARARMSPAEDPAVVAPLTDPAVVAPPDDPAVVAPAEDPAVVAPPEPEA